MLKGISLNEVLEYSSVKDEGEPKTIFLIGNITHKDKIRLFDGMDTSKVAMSKAFDVLKIGLRGIKNLNGKDYESITEEVLELIPFEVIGELLGKIVEFNRLGEAERKN